MLSQYDKDKDGKIDVDEWDAMREAALKEVLARHQELKSAPPVNMMTKTCDSRRPYILSALPQNSLVKRFHFYSIALIILFFTSGVAATWLISQRISGN